MVWWPRAPADETARAWWYAEGLFWPERDGSLRVGSLVPSSYDAYLRVDHRSCQGELPTEIASRLREHLRTYTTTPDRVLYAAWDGRSPATHPAFASMPRLHATQRTYIVFLGDLTGPFVDLPDDVHEESPLIVHVWLPMDRAWCVVTDLGSHATYVGCSSSCARALLDDEALEASPVTLLDRVDSAS